MVSGEKTVLIKANPKSCSLRTTVPKGIVEQFDLNSGDVIIWKIKADKNKKGLIVVIEPMVSSKAVR